MKAYFLPLLAACPVHFIQLGLILIIIFAEEYTL
jgi:hypothetical protein